MLSLLLLAANVAAQVVMLQGGFSAGTGSSQTQLRYYDSTRGFWGDRTPGTGTVPPAASTFGRSAVWANNLMYVFYGCSGVTGTGRVQTVWSYNPDTNVWATVTTSGNGNRPSARCYHSTVLDTNNNAVLLFGGQTGDSTYDNRVFRLTPTSATAAAWTAFTDGTGATRPTARGAHSAIWSTTDRSMYIYGGYIHNAFGGVDRYNSLYRLTITAPTTSTWTFLSPSGTAPASSDSHCAVYSSAANSFYIYGGGATAANSALLYQYNIAGVSWTNIVPQGTPLLALRGHSCYYLERDNKIFAMGGSTTTTTAGVSTAAVVQEINLDTRMVATVPLTGVIPPGFMYSVLTPVVLPATSFPTSAPMSAAPTVPSAAPSATPTAVPTEIAPPTFAPTQPTFAPTFPTHSPGYTEAPTPSPTAEPTAEPTLAPATFEPTADPTTSEPTRDPTTSEPTREPTTDEPTRAPVTDEPTTDAPHAPSDTEAPTREPSTDAPHAPSETPVPTEFPTASPTTAESPASDSNFLGTGMNAAAFFGIIAGVVLALALVLFCFCRRKNAAASDDESRPFNRL